jgi:hypothetical protein
MIPFEYESDPTAGNRFNVRQSCVPDGIGADPSSPAFVPVHTFV